MRQTFALMNVCETETEPGSARIGPKCSETFAARLVSSAVIFLKVCVRACCVKPYKGVGFREIFFFFFRRRNVSQEKKALLQR